MIRVTRSLAIDAGEISFRFVRASGPGGQNVNKVATAAQLRFDVAGSASLPDDVRERLVRLAGRRMTAAGVLVIDARRFRSQERNRADAIARLVALVRKAAEPPRPRRKTRPPKVSKKRRLADKRRRATLKRSRGTVPPSEE